ncbi:MAG: thiamine pyrophosphate-dependent enzyme [Candidatus Altiarchaeota archaeon]
MTGTKAYDIPEADMAWCPGCGNFGILDIMKSSFTEIGLKPTELVVVSGIGQAAKAPHYMNCNMFNGLHGRALPAAAAIKTSNPGLKVVVESGDGDMYGEGGNHFIHAIRRNPDITCIIHNNMVYGLTKGQASPTSQMGFRTPIQTEGVTEEPFNPLAVAIALDASFVARAYCADAERTKELIKAAILHRGFSIVDVFQPCVTFNKVNTYRWFRENTYYLEGHDPADRNMAFKRATETGKLPLGLFYEKKGRTVFEDATGAYANNREPLYRRTVDASRLKALIESMRG